MNLTPSLRRLVWILALAGCSTPVGAGGGGALYYDAGFTFGDVSGGTKKDVVPVDTAVESDTGEVPGEDATVDPGEDTQDPPVGVQYVISDDAATDKAAAQAIGGVAGVAGTAVQVVYPPDHAMAPSDFAPITVQWTYAGPAVTFFVVRFANALAEIDIVGDAAAWKDGPGYSVTIPTAIWPQLFDYLLEPSWTLTVLAGQAQGGGLVGALQASAPRTFDVSGDKAGGAIYYWNTGLSAVRVLEAGSLQPTTLPAGNGSCVGCHSISPDGSTVALNTMGGGGGGGGGGSFSMALVSGKSAGSLSWVSPNATKALASSNTIAAAFSATYFTATDKRLVVPRAGKLTSVDLITGATAPLVQGGDLGQQAFPSWSPDGTTVVYVSAANASGMSIGTATKLYTVPYNNGAGGQATPIAGANEANVFQYYPAVSVDGQYVAYNRAAMGGTKCPSTGGGGGGGGGPGGAAGASTYDNCHAELWLVPTAGGTAMRLDRANQDTTALTNSWPTFGNVKGQKYWMAFSSRRNYGFKHTGNPAAPQVYVAAVDPVLAAQGVDPSSAALWLPGQDINAGCHIARWSAKPRD